MTLKSFLTASTVAVAVIALPHTTFAQDPQSQPPTTTAPQQPTTTAPQPPTTPPTSTNPDPTQQPPTTAPRPATTAGTSGTATPATTDRLPHTASPLPLMMLLSFAAFAGAGLVRFASGRV